MKTQNHSLAIEKCSNVFMVEMLGVSKIQKSQFVVSFVNLRGGRKYLVDSTFSNSGNLLKSKVTDI